MTTPPTTCGAQYHALVTMLFPSLDDNPLGLHALLRQCPDDQSAFGCFALGTMSGQAEKVALGACRAFMVRPAPEWLEWTIEAMELICGHYGLRMFTDLPRGEVWGCADTVVLEDVQHCASALEENGHLWHMTRARLCGIPENRVDVQYHERNGYLARCEPKG